MSPLPLLALEVNAVLHCNLSCVGCSHASPTTSKSFSNPDIIHRDLAALATAVTVQELRVLGGEPLLHPRLPELLDAIRSSGISGRIRVITNGTRLHLTPWDWVAHTDDVHLSNYPGTNVRPDALQELERRCSQLGKELVVKRYHSFRLVHPARPLDDGDSLSVFETCQDAHAWSCHTVHEGHLYLCPASAASDHVPPDERCPLTPVDTLLERLERFLLRRDPVSACRTCLGTVGSLVPHRQANARTWHALSHRGEIDREQLERVRADRWADIGCSHDELVVAARTAERS